MAHQMFLVHLHEEARDDDGARDELAAVIHGSGGFILMAAGRDALIAAFDDRRLAAVQRHAAVEFCGGLQLDPNGAASAKLRMLFARNVAAQLAGRQSPDAEASGSGLRYRAHAWHLPVAGHPNHDNGVSVFTTTTSTR